MAASTRKPRSQPYQVQWPLTPTQVENVNEMLNTIFDELKRMSERMDAQDARMTAGGI